MMKCITVGIISLQYLSPFRITNCSKVLQAKICIHMRIEYEAIYKVLILSLFSFNLERNEKLCERSGIYVKLAGIVSQT